jgi:hypothetical protein
MTQRPLCPVCNDKPVAVNYIKEDVPHYRKLCDSCIRKGKKLKPLPPLWVKRGYRKKPQCDQCGFKFKFVEQSLVYHVDGNLSNCDHNNIKTVCRNCSIELSKSRLPWKPAKVVPDF